MEVEDQDAAPTPAVARIPDATRYLRISRSGIYRLIRAGRLRTVHLGARSVGITYAELDRFLATQA